MDLKTSIRPSTFPGKPGYRPEIDGLRAFAILAVIINHFNKDILPSGYLGVDIFFVVSGYVITASLSGRESKNFGDFLSGFYERRIKRLVPALVLFIVIINALSWLLMAPDGVGGAISTRSSLTALIGLSNLYIYKQATDYFSVTAELNPFLHTWSLGVEEQFYLLFPLIIWFSGFGRQEQKGARNLFIWMGALALASLTGFIYLYQTNQPAAYFLMPTRFWEMAAGCLVFIGFQRRVRIEHALEKLPPFLVVTAMLAVMFLPIDAAVTATILMVVLSAVLIACLKKKTAAFCVFTNKIVVYTGLISYSLYLWHGSILALSRWSIGIHWWSVPLQLFLMIAVAVGSYQWIETPFRRWEWFGKRKYTILASFILIAVAAAIALLGGSRTAQAGSRSQGKMINDNNKGAAPCKKQSFKLLFMGDSHASHYLQKPIKSCQELNYETGYIGANGTIYPLINYTNSVSGRTRERNNQNNEFIVRQLDTVALPGHSQGIVIISIRPSLYFYTNIGAYRYDIANHFDPLSDEYIPKQKAMANWLHMLELYISLHADTRFALFIPNPEFNSLYPQEVCLKKWFRPFLSSQCQAFVERKKELERHEQFIAGLRNIEKRYSNAKVFDAFSVLCPQKSLRCRTSVNRIRLYDDDNHLNPEGAHYVLSRFERWIKDFRNDRMPS